MQILLRGIAAWEEADHLLQQFECLGCRNLCASCLTYTLWRRPLSQTRLEPLRFDAASQRKIFPPACSRDHPLATNGFRHF